MSKVATWIRRVVWRWAAAIGLGSKVVLIGLFYLYMVFYSYLIQPGQDQAFYERYVQEHNVIFSLLSGLPVFLLLGWWLGRRHPDRATVTALVGWVLYIVLDIPLELTLGGLFELGLVLVATHLSKLAALYAGVWLATRAGKPEIKAGSATVAGDRIR